MSASARQHFIGKHFLTELWNSICDINEFLFEKPFKMEQKSFTFANFCQFALVGCREANISTAYTFNKFINKAIKTQNLRWNFSSFCLAKNVHITHWYVFVVFQAIKIDAPKCEWLLMNRFLTRVFTKSLKWTMPTFFAWNLHWIVSKKIVLLKNPEERNG